MANSLSQAALPRDHLVSELAAIPLASEHAFRCNLQELDPTLGGETGALWRAVETSTLGSFPHTSVDHLVAVRDRVWFGTGPSRGTGRMSLVHYLRDLSHKVLRRAGAEVIPQPLASRPSGSQRRRPADLLGRRLWRWMSFALPPDLLVAGLVGDGEANAVTMEQPTLARALKDLGFAETHLHVGAGMDFPTLWISVQLGLASGQVGSRDFASPGAQLSEGREFGSWLLRASLARLLLACHLVRSRRSPSAGNFFLSLRDFLPDPSERAMVRLALQELARGRLLPPTATEALDPGFADLRALLRKLCGITRRSIPKRLADFLLADPIQPYFPCLGGESPSSEMAFVEAALSYLSRREGGDRDFARLFWQVLRIRGMLYRHLIHRPLTPGLQWFVRTYSRIEPSRKALSRCAVLESCAHRSGITQGLRSLEVRTSPDPDRSRLLEIVETYDKCFRQLAQDLEPSLGIRARELEFGLVFHLARHRGGGLAEGKPQAHWKASAADPFENGIRYAGFFRKKRREVSSLCWLLRTFPLSLAIVRGFDVCTDELGVPNWVMVPLLRELRCQAENAARFLAQREGAGRVSRLPRAHLTVHAGEDFVHLLGGLRRIDEALEHFRLKEGDRIGHGMALGVHASKWARDSGELAVLREERLFDLVWEWSWYQQANGSPRPRRIS
ncbi:MAG: hypothetical protein KDD47_17615, partial [Acidobacteria bacterium]|nr:hypothetical protein [Acidobacteriota bacterium]